MQQQQHHHHHNALSNISTTVAASAAEQEKTNSNFRHTSYEQAYMNCQQQPKMQMSNPVPQQRYV